MNVMLIFIWVWAAFVAMAFWESSVEGKHPWDRRKVGWKIRFGKRYSLPQYQFFVLFVFLPLLLTLPFIIYGFDFKIFGILLSATLTGLVIEDFLWFVVNPEIKFKDSFNPKFVYYYPWINFFRLQIPLGYIFGIVASILSWYFIWK